MISRRSYILLIFTIAAFGVALAIWAWPMVRGLWPAIGPAAPIPTEVSEPGGESISGPLQTVSGWRVSVLSDSVAGARDMVLDFQGNIWVSQPAQGTVSLLTFDRNGQLVDVSPVLRDLDRPHGLVFDPDEPLDLYVATETRVLRVRVYSDARPEQIASLPAGGRHRTRTLAFGSDGRLYVSIGSTCDTCVERNPEHGSVISMKKDGSDRRIDAVGLRNAVFITAHAGTIWATEMGRDHLGDDLPPDELNMIPIDMGGLGPRDYGWPNCYGKKIPDRTFNTDADCSNTFASEVDLQAHVAPLGLAFIPRTNAWPADWQGDLLVAYHGSWNRSVPVGYKVVKFDVVGGAVVPGSETDLITGFLVGSSALGRPVDVVPTDNGVLYISDDKAGVMWKMEQVR